MCSSPIDIRHIIDNPSFNLVRPQMDHIRSLSTIGEVRAALSALPMLETDFYSQSIVRIKNNEAQSEKAMKVLAWVLKAAYPLKTQEIVHAVAIKPDESSINSYLDFISPVEDLIDSCEGLVLVNENSETLAFAHPTVNEFLELRIQSVFAIDPQITISHVCLTYLLFDEIQELYKEYTISFNGTPSSRYYCTYAETGFLMCVENRNAYILKSL